MAYELVLTPVVFVTKNHTCQCYCQRQHIFITSFLKNLRRVAFAKTTGKMSWNTTLQNAPRKTHSQKLTKRNGLVNYDSRGFHLFEQQHSRNDGPEFGNEMVIPHSLGVIYH